MSKQHPSWAAFRRKPRDTRQSGVTLVELMVALVLGLVLTGGFIQVFLANRTTYAFNEGLSRLQENGRFALDTLSFRVRMAGFRGCLPDVPLFNNLGSAADLAFDFEQALIGFEADGTAPGDEFTAASSNPANSTSPGDWTPTLPAELRNRVIPGSDVIVVRSVSAAAHALRSPFSDADTVHVNAPAGTYVVGDIAVVSDCQKASVFQVTGAAAAGGGLDLTHAAGGTPGNALQTWDTDQLYGAGAEVMRGETWIYFVGTRAGGGSPALYQARLQTNSAASRAELVYEEIADSVETMQVLYGVDTNADNRVDEYRTANAVADWDEVVAVRVSLLLRAPDEYGTETDTSDYLVNGTLFDPVDDRRVRQVFTTTIALRNRLP